MVSYQIGSNHILVLAFCQGTSFIWNFYTKIRQHLCQYAEKTDLVSCNLIHWTLFHYSIMSWFSFNIPTLIWPNKYIEKNVHYYMSKAIGQFLITWPSVMLYTDHNTILTSQYLAIFTDVILYYCDVILYYCLTKSHIGATIV